MNEHSGKYIARCVDIGILTDVKIRAYPLRPLNLAYVLKAYAVSANLPYVVRVQDMRPLTGLTYYLTDAGLEWLYEFFKEHTLVYLKSVFQVPFLGATEDLLKDYTKYPRFGNFRGEIGEQPKAGTKQRAILRRYHALKHTKIQEFPFDTLFAARAAFTQLSRYYPPEDFRLFRLVPYPTKSGTAYREREEKLILTLSGRSKVNERIARGKEQ